MKVLLRIPWAVSLMVYMISSSLESVRCYSYRHRRQVALKGDLKWPNAVVPYWIDPSEYSARSLKNIKKCMNIIEDVSCVRFIPWTDQIDYLNITGKCLTCRGRCAADQGRASWEPNYLKLDDSVKPCAAHQGLVLHELMHVLGFIHEHQRPDRDTYVRINCRNIHGGCNGETYHKNFHLYTNDELTLTSGYDYRSIMQYHDTASGGDKVTIKNKVPPLAYITLLDEVADNVHFIHPMNWQENSQFSITSGNYQSGSRAASLENVIYVTGPEKACWQYETSKDGWSICPSMKLAHADHAFGIDSDEGILMVCGGKYLKKAQCETWKIGSSSWQTIDAPFSSRLGAAMEYFSNQLVVIGGLEWEEKRPSKEVWSYRTTHSKWTKLPSTLEYRIGSSTAVWKDSLYVCGGAGDVPGITCEVFSERGAWKMMKSFLGRAQRDFAMFVLSGQMWVIGNGNAELYDFDRKEWMRITNTSFFKLFQHPRAFVTY